MAQCLLGKDRLWRGQPLLIRLEGLRSRWLGLKKNSVSVALRSCEGGVLVSPVLAAPHLLPGIIAAETLDVAAGSYELVVLANGDRISPPAMVNILDGPDYLAVLRHEASEEFFLEPPVASAAGLQQELENLVTEVWIGPRPRIQVSWQACDPVPAGPIWWVNSSILRSLRYLGVFGVKEATGFVSVRSEEFEAGFDVELRTPLLESVIEAITNDRYSDLNFFFGVNGLGPSELDLKIDKTHAHIAVRHVVPVEEFAF